MLYLCKLLNMYVRIVNGWIGSFQKFLLFIATIYLWTKSHCSLYGLIASCCGHVNEFSGSVGGGKFFLPIERLLSPLRWFCTVQFISERNIQASFVYTAYAISRWCCVKLCTVMLLCSECSLSPISGVSPFANPGRVAMIKTHLTCRLAALRSVFSRTIQFSPVSIIPPLLHIHSCVIWGLDSGPVSDRSSAEIRAVSRLRNNNMYALCVCICTAEVNNPVIMNNNRRLYNIASRELYIIAG
jgi:hypothetical protein